MPSIRASWICRNCGGMHRVKYPIITDMARFTKINLAWTHDRHLIKIVDPAYEMDLLGGKRRKDAKSLRYGVLVDSEIPIHIIIETMRDYLNKYYTLAIDTLTVEICQDD